MRFEIGDGFKHRIRIKWGVQEEKRCDPGCGVVDGKDLNPPPCTPSDCDDFKFYNLKQLRYPPARI